MTPKRRLGVCALTVFFPKKTSVVTNLWILFKQHILSHQAIIENNWPAPQNRDCLKVWSFLLRWIFIKKKYRKALRLFPLFPHHVSVAEIKVEVISTQKIGRKTPSLIATRSCLVIIAIIYAYWCLYYFTLWLYYIYLDTWHYVNHLTQFCSSCSIIFKWFELNCNTWIKCF